MQNDEYIGMVKLPFIFQVVKVRGLGMQRNPSFQMSISMHFKRNKKEGGRRDLIFSC